MSATAVAQYNPHQVAQQQGGAVVATQQNLPATHDMLNQLQELFATAARTQAVYDPEQHLKTTDFDQHTDRRYFVTLTASLNELARGTVEAKWQAEPGCEHIYQRIASIENGKPVFEGDTTKGVILGMELESVTSTFPIDIGATITGVQGKTFLANGKNYAFVIEGKADREPKACIFEPESKITREMLNQYNDTSATKMESHCFRGDNGETLVDNLSPLAKMLRLNQEVLNMTFGMRPEAEGFLRVDSTIVDACLACYDAQQKVNFVDYNTFRIDFERVDAALWNEPVGVIDNLRNTNRGDNSHIANQRMANKYTLKCVIRGKSVLYGNKKSTPAK